MPIMIVEKLYDNSCIGRIGFQWFDIQELPKAFMSFCNNFDNRISKDNSLVNWKYEQKAAQNLSRAAKAVAN